MSGFLSDLRFAARLSWRDKGFTAVAALVLALGIGSTTVMYSAVDGVLMRPLPYPEPDRIVRLWSKWSNGGFGSVSLPDFVDWRAQSKTLERMSALGFGDYTLVRDGRGERISGLRVSPDFFALLGVQPALGRTFSADAFVHGNEVVLSHGLWQSRFGGKRDVLGQTVRLSDGTVVVVGVLPATFRLPVGSVGGGGVLLPLVADAGAKRDSHFLQVLARVRPDATLDGARAELVSIARALELAYPASNKERSVLLRGWQASLTAQLRPALLLLFGAVVLVLVIACANVANMLLARAAARQGELAVRVALGAGRARIVRQLLTECLLLALVGGIGGVVLSCWGVDAVRAALPSRALFEPRLDARALGFAALVAIGSTFAFGLVPALRAARRDLASAVKDGSRSITSARSRLRATLVVLQVALSFALLVGAALLGRSFVRVAGVDPGFDARGVVTMQMTLPESKAPGLFFARVLDRVSGMPQVSSAGVVDFLPLSQSNINGGFFIEGKTFDDPNRFTEYMVASPGYFDTMRMHVRRGRGFTAGDTATSERVCIVNQRMADKYFGGEDPVGKHLRLEWNDDDKGWMTVVGVLGDNKRWGLDGEPTPETWVPLAQQPYRAMALAVRGRVPPSELAAAVQREVAAVDPTEATFDVTTMAEVVDESLKPRRLLLDFIVFFGAAALVLAAIGLYGLLAVQVAQRTRELGIRMALGATPDDVRGLVVRHGLYLTLAGAAVGAVAALALSSLLGSMLYGVTATDPASYVAVAVTLIAIAAVASWLPARRATSIDPMSALRA